MTTAPEPAFIRGVKRSIRIRLIFGALLLGFGALILLFPSRPNFVCHRLMDGAVSHWMLETTNGVWFPNVGGSSSNSLALVAPYMSCSMHDLRDYRYVPGLRSDDPGNLILFYLKEPSRRTWHGEFRWSRKPKRWIVLPIGMGGNHELAEALTTTEFKTRLNESIEYLKKHERLGWKNAEGEHMALLNSLNE